jgi:RecB family endonuclease NucS
VKRLGQEGLEPAGDEDEEKVSDAEEFQILEKGLQSYLAKNLALVEGGMTLWKSADGQSAIEFSVDEKGRRIDILAKDKSGTPVVIELKAGSGHERVIGQALYYRECIREKLNTPKVRTFIIAREISDEVRIASRAVPDVELFEYKLSMTLAKI